MKISLLLFIILQSFTLAAQDNNKIIGSWKMISLKDASVFYDIKTDSLFLKEFEELTAEEKKANAGQLVLHKQSLNKSVAQSFMKFNTDLSFDGRLVEPVDRSGKYIINETEKTIVLTLKKDGGKQVNESEKLKYKFEKNRLVLFGFPGQADFVVEFEKQ